MAESSIVARFREGKGKGVARRLRAEGRVPAVLYGRRTEAVSLSLDPRALHRLLTTSHAGLNTLIDLTVEDRSDIGQKVVLIKELQRHPAYGTMLHADLYEVDLEHKIQVAVPVHLKGTAHGVTMGGVLDHSLREVEVECLPRAIPDEFVLDVSGLDIGQSLHVRDIQLPEGVELRDDPELGVVSVMARVEEEEVKPEGEEAEAAAAEAADEAAATEEGAEKGKAEKGKAEKGKGAD